MTNGVNWIELILAYTFRLIVFTNFYFSTPGIGQLLALSRCQPPQQQQQEEEEEGENTTHFGLEKETGFAQIQSMNLNMIMIDS